MRRRTLRPVLAGVLLTLLGVVIVVLSTAAPTQESEPTSTDPAAVRSPVFAPARHDKGARHLRGRAIELNGEVSGVETDADGAFTVDRLAAGRYFVVARSHAALAISAEVVVDVASARGPLRMRACPAASLRGSIVDDADAPICDSGEAFVASTTTDALYPSRVNGTDFELLGVVPGRYAVTVRCPGGPVSSELGTIELATGTQDHAWRIPRGRVLRGLIETASGEPSADAKITAKTADGGVHLGRSGEDGSFELFGLPADDLILIAIGADGDRSDEVEVRSDDFGVLARVQLRARAVIEGGVLDGSGEGVPDVHVRASATTSGARAISAGDGGFALTGLTGGEYRVGVEGRADDEDTLTVAVHDGEVVTVELIEENEQGSLQGGVVDSDGNAAPDVSGMSQGRYCTPTCSEGPP